MHPTFEHEGDVLPEGRHKFIHPSGVLAKFKYKDLGGHNFTGSLKGTDHGILRISDAGFAKPDINGHATPSMGLKFFVDGQEA
jgi:hypothetical protein